MSDLNKKLGEYVTCPFCGEDDFDLIGLKLHFYNWCEVFPTIDLDADNRVKYKL